MGISEVSKTNKGTAMRILFPFYQEMLYILALAIFSRFTELGFEFEIADVEKQ